MRRPEERQIETWRKEPVRFVTEVCGVRPAASYVTAGDPWPSMDWFQQEMLEALPTNDRISLQACKGPGKTAGLAWAILWFMTVYPFAKVAAVSYTADNLRDNLWTELKKWMDRNRLLSETLEWTATRVYNREFRDNWWASARSFPKSATADEQATTLSGLHNDHMMFVMDEAGAIPTGVLATADAALANRVSKRTVAKLVLAGNPSTIDGSLYYASVEHREDYWTKEISGDPDDPKRARRINAEDARKKINDLGRDHDWVRVNILGKFPKGQENSLISLDDVTAAYNTVLRPEDISYAPRLMGVDCARFGQDRTVILKRQGRGVFDDVTILQSRDEVQIAREMVRIINDWHPHKIFIDTTGIGGGVASILKHNGHARTVVEVNSSVRKGIENTYFNLRMLMWAEMAKWLRSNQVYLPRIPGFTKELTSPTFWYRPEDNKMQLESKEDMILRIQHSPDIADALALTFAFPVAPPVASSGGTPSITATGGQCLTERTDGRWRR